MRPDSDDINAGAVLCRWDALGDVDLEHIEPPGVLWGVVAIKPPRDLPGLGWRGAPHGAGGVSGITDAEVAHWRAAIGRNQMRREQLSTEVLRRFALAIGAEAEVERVQPVLAHWAYFLDAAPDAELGEDGHPRRGGFLPDIPLPRRMVQAVRCDGAVSTSARLTYR